MQAQEPLAVPWKPLPLDGILELLGVVTVNGLRTKLSPEMRCIRPVTRPVEAVP